jgi:hypothetical protein
MDRRTFVSRVAVVAGSAAIAGCITDADIDAEDDGGNDPDEGGGNDGDADATTEAPDTTAEPAQPAGTRWYDPDTEVGVMDGVEAEVDSIGSMYIRGTAKNFGDTDYGYVQLEFEVYDDTDAKIADGLANTSGLDAGQRWRFEALAPGADDAASYALTGISAS